MNRRSFLKFIPFTPHLLSAGVDVATDVLYGATQGRVAGPFIMRRTESFFPRVYPVPDFVVNSSRSFRGGSMLQRFCEATRTGRHAKRLEPGGDILTVNQIFRKGGYQADMLDVRGWE